MIIHSELGRGIKDQVSINEDLCMIHRFIEEQSAVYPQAVLQRSRHTQSVRHLIRRIINYMNQFIDPSLIAEVKLLSMLQVSRAMFQESTQIQEVVYIVSFHRKYTYVLLRSNNTLSRSVPVYIEAYVK